ncbi:MAG TPA: hypothetical protein VLL08_30265 [Kineosporiaceae bacterium]|nr:hypothetical protein [Kineosporiaceae bacterium]
MNAGPGAGASAAQVISTRLRSLADGMDAAAGALPGDTSGWHSPAASAAGRLLAARPAQFRAVAVACRAAAVALSGHADALSSAAALTRQSEQVPVELAAMLERRATDVIDESTRRAADSLLTLAGSAPARQQGWRGGLNRVDEWRSEVLIGAAESTEMLAGAALKLASRATNPFRRPPPIAEVRRAEAVVADAVHHPLEVGKAVLDWDTWRTNPFRAVGHLGPDAVAAAVSGGTAAGVRATTIAERGRSAARIAAARDTLRREATGTAAAAARQALIARVQTDALARVTAGDLRVTAWQGEGGIGLSALQNAGVEAYHSISVAQERSLTAVMQAVSKAAQGELFGLDHRLKTPESAKRKVATADGRTRGGLPALLTETNDTIRYSVVINDANYVRAVSQIASALERRSFHARLPHNAWHGPRYRGINSVWVDPATGTAFEVQFHTPASYRTTKLTHRMFEEYRRPGISGQRKAELHELIAAQYRKVPIPGWVEALQGKNFPPPSAPDPVVPPANYTGPAAVAGAVAVQLPATGLTAAGLGPRPAAPESCP